MRIPRPAPPVPRDEAATFRFSVFVRGDVATVKVRAGVDTAFYECPAEDLFEQLTTLFEQLP